MRGSDDVTLDPVSEPREARAGGGVYAWDLPTRLFKWSLVGFIITAWVSSGFDDPTMKVHKLAGYGILILVLYRIFWGAVGGSTARFSSFVRSPSKVIAYLRAAREHRARPYLGHNPAGGVMILALILACGLQAVLGLFATDGVTASGPLADAVGDTISAWASHLHSLWFYAILGLAVIHIAMNLYYQFVKGENLIGAMITGRKKAAAYQDAHEAEPGSPVVALLCLLAASAIVYFGITAWGGSLLGQL